MRQRFAQWLLVSAESTLQAFDERGDSVDGQPSLLEVGLGSLLGRQVQQRELPQPDGVVGDDVRHRRLRELLSQRAQLLTGGFVVGSAGVAGRRSALGLFRVVRFAGRPECAHADILTSSHQSWEVGPAFAAFPTRPTFPQQRVGPSPGSLSRPPQRSSDGGLPESAIFASRSTRPDRCGATDPVQQRYQRGDHIATDDARINDRIRAREVLLIGAGGEQLGIKPLPEALTIAREEELDLVEVAPNANPPVCRIMNFGRYKYEQEQRRKESRKKATNVVVKEMKFRPKIDEHDYVTKMKHVERFLAEGSKVKLTIMFRGREVFHPELGLRILERVAEQVNDIAIVESAPRQDGRNMTMVLHPIKRPAKARAAAAPPPPTGNGSEGEQ